MNNLKEQRFAHRVQVCQDLLDHLENDKEFLSKIITGDESWVYGY